MGQFATLPIPDGVVVQPIVDYVGDEATNVIPIHIRLMDARGRGVVKKRVAIQVRAADNGAILDSDNDLGVISSANADTTFSNASPAVGTILPASGTAGTVTVITDANGEAHLYVGYTGADDKYIGFSQAFGGAVVVGTNMKILSFA